MKKLSVSTWVLAVASLLWACAYQSPYVGKRLDTSSAFWCNCRNFPASCHVETEYFVFDCSVSAPSSVGEAVVRGTATYTGKGGFSRFAGGSASPTMPAARFVVLTARKGVVTGSFSLYLGDDSFSRPIAISGTIKERDFDAIAFVYGGTFRD